jgi:hypothetical protein
MEEQADKESLRQIIIAEFNPFLASLNATEFFNLCKLILKLNFFKLTFQK